jgi:lambda repressor-like predicted transcriptional regulator
MNRLLVKHRLLDKQMSLVDLSRQIGLPYDRVIRLVNGYRQPKPEEIDLVAKALELSPERLAEGTE